MGNQVLEQRQTRTKVGDAKPRAFRHDFIMTWLPGYSRGLVFFVAFFKGEKYE
ncbi:hypothetical protein J2T20_004843 [Paenibacillus wynnii]|nr:hypothetical protein [Paenibacillus wynnii]